ncbi:MAG TPA: hypothetical protein VN742_07160 [Candidatus Binataceae bacterium]|nr:hypothetical protein [Candidatus Binataceae bacterium]
MFRSRTLLVVSVAALILVGCGRALPEESGPAAQLYTARCGSCHQAYAPRSLTAAMWEIQVSAMQARIAAAGQAPLSPEEQRTILDYLRRNAGGQ